MDGSGHQNAAVCQSQTPKTLRILRATKFPSFYRINGIPDRGALLGRRLSRIENDNDESDWGRLVTLSRGPSRISCEALA